MMHLTKHQKFWIAYLTPAIIQIGVTVWARRRGPYINYLQGGNIWAWPGWWPILSFVPLADIFDVKEDILGMFKWGAYRDDPTAEGTE